MKTIIFWIVFAFGAFSFIQCNGLKGKSFVPEIYGYSEKNKARILLKRSLQEISGIDYVNDRTLVAINDEAGKLFFLNPQSGEPTAQHFGTHDDYEDVVKVNNRYYVLASSGKLVVVNGDTFQQEQIFTKETGKHTEFETVYFDAEHYQLVLICKQCGRNATEINAWAFNLKSGQFADTAYFTIPISTIRQLSKNNSQECKTSAAAINPVNEKLYIVASVGKLMLECTINGALEKVYHLNPDYFPQPEGLTFSPEGDMYISNEGLGAMSLS